MPRVRPKQPRFAADAVVKAWQAFAVDIGGVGHTVSRGTRLRASHSIVEGAPWNFVLDATPDEEMPSPLPPYEETGPMFSGPTRIRFVPRFTNSSVVLIGARSYRVGEEVTVPAGTAEHLVSEGYAVPA